MTPRLRLTMSLAVLLSLAAAMFVAADLPEPAPRLTPEQLARLKEIRSRILEAGVIESADVLRLNNQVPLQTTVVSAVPDGVVVKRGDLLLRLDDAPLREALAELQIDVGQAEAAVAGAKAELEAAERLAKLELPVAKLELKAAELARQRHFGEDGELEFETQRVEREIDLAQRQMKIDANAEARAAMSTARAKKALLERYVRPHEAAEAELAVSRANASLQRVRAEAARAKQETEAALRTAESKLQQQRARLKEIEEQLQHCQVTAPRDGVVVHAVVSSGRGASATSLQAGATVRHRQPLLEMPDLDRLRARIHVNQSQIARVRAGQAVALQLDAIPGRTFRGKVAEVSRVPESKSWLAPSTVEYSVLVTLVEQSPAIKVGMTVAAEIDAPPAQ